MNLLSVPAAMRPMMAKQLLAASGITDPIAHRMADRLLGGKFSSPTIAMEEQDGGGETVVCTAHHEEEVITVTLTYRKKT